MNLSVYLTQKAEETLESTLSFVEERWGKKSEVKLKTDIIRILKLISAQPYMFKASSLDSQLRKGHISKQTSFFYEVREGHILVLYFWDNRQEPIID